MNFNDIVRCTLSALRTGDKSLVESLVTVSVLPRSESSTLHLLAITTAGLSLSFSLSSHYMRVVLQVSDSISLPLPMERKVGHHC